MKIFYVYKRLGLSGLFFVCIRLKELLQEYATNMSVDILKMEIIPDHVHILMEVDPQFGIHKAVKT